MLKHIDDDPKKPQQQQQQQELERQLRTARGVALLFGALSALLFAVLVFLFVCPPSSSSLSSLSSSSSVWFPFFPTTTTTTTTTTTMNPELIPETPPKESPPKKTTKKKEQDRYLVDPANYRRYTSGEHRRPTDPATEQEIGAALDLLYGGGIYSVAQADALLENTRGWAAVNAHAASPSHVLDPLAFASANHLPWAMEQKDAEAAFFAKYRELGNDLDATYLWARAQPDIRNALRWNVVESTTTIVPDKEMVLAFDQELDDGADEADFRKYLGVKVLSGVAEIRENGEAWNAETIVSVDVTDPTAPFVVESLLDVTYRFLRNLDDPIPERAPLKAVDIAYLTSAAQSLYGANGEGERRFFLPFYLTNQYNFLGYTYSWNGALKFFVQPFQWLEGESAVLYGAKRTEMIMTAQLMEYTSSVKPLDAHGVMGAMVFPNPLSMVYSALYDMKDRNNLLENSEAIAMTWYGRGLSFTMEEAKRLRDAIHYTEPECRDMRILTYKLQAETTPPDSNRGTYFKLPNCIEILPTTDYQAIRETLVDAIYRAWGEESIFDFYPGRLVTRETDGALVPEPVRDHPYDNATYVNHATATVVEEAMGRKHDMSRNMPEIRPPKDGNGKMLFTPVGHHLETVADNGPSFIVDGYSVTWNAGVTWKFNIGNMDDAGLTFFNIRLITPPSEAHPEGETIPYLWKLNIPHFGTTYSGSSMGNIYQAAFLESHYRDGVGLVPGANCRGPHVTLPVFRARGITTIGEYTRPIFYSTYGVDGYNDPIAEALLGVEWPFNSFPLERETVNNGFMEHAICIQEEDYEVSMWHLYTAQSKRSLAIFSSAITEAYNVVNRFQFDSDGKITVSERLNGQPAIMSHGIPGAGGAYSTFGRGNFGPNHIHWIVVGMEPHLLKNQEGVKNTVGVVDLALGADDDSTNWFGLAMHRRHTAITQEDEVDKMRYDFLRQRYWEIRASDAAGKRLGGLKLVSRTMGPPLFTDMYQAPLRFGETDFLPEDTHLNHWWLQQNIWVTNAESVPSQQGLLVNSKTPDCRVGFNITRCSKNNADPIGDDPAIYMIMHLYHGVVTEEMPVQNGFTDVNIEIHPHNLFAFNPNLLVRQTPEHADVIQNPYMVESTIYTQPYESEWTDTAAATNDDLAK